jgi:hypothetical protein
MPEVGLGAALERFELDFLGEQQCVVDIVNDQQASIILTALPEFPLEIDATRARQFVAAWRQRHNILAQPYDIHQQQREV